MRSISTDYSQNLQERVIFFIYFLSLIVLSQRHRMQMVNEADKMLLGKQPRYKATAVKNPRKMNGKNCNLRTLSCEYDSVAKIGTKEAFTLLLGN